MHRLLVLIILGCLSNWLPASTAPDSEFDNGSGITFQTLSVQQLNNLNVLGKVWGFLKYHHPAVTTGEYNWDYELFRVMPTIFAANSVAQRDSIILQWIDQYGELPACEQCAYAADAYLKPAHQWIKADGLSIPLQTRLQHIYTNRYQGQQHYVNVATPIGIPLFNNENPYSEMPYPDTGFRLLALFRYWNMIHYFFPYRDITAKLWGSVLSEHIPHFIRADNELAYEIALLRLIGDVQDGHASLVSGADKLESSKGNRRVPIRVKFIEDQLVVTGFYTSERDTKVSLAVGDIITTINNRPIADIVAERFPNYPASNQVIKYQSIAADILRSNDTHLSITYLHNGNRKSAKLELQQDTDLNIDPPPLPDEQVKSYYMLPDNIGYITLATIQDEDIQNIENDFSQTKGIIVDIRNYPSTYVVFSLGDYFTPADIPFVKFTTANVNNPGEFTFSEPFSVGTRELKDVYQGKVVILVNEDSVSQSEYTAMSFRVAPDATVIGSTTAGADGNVTRMLLPGGITTSISGVGIFYPDGTPTQQIGIIPDIEVKPTIEGLKQGRDEVLEKAIVFINNN